MCGIAGVIASDPQRVQAALSAMVRAQVHRGPDDGGEVVVAFGDRRLGLGQRRLSIIDLSPAGHQPMAHPETGDLIVFNGEIYNFQALRTELEGQGTIFRGHSDTEVLLHGLTRWGTDYIQRLEGMYAFAYFDQRNQRLLLARDPLGIKPLYLASASGAFLFASEVRALLASRLLSPAIDRQALVGFLAYGAVPEPLTFVEGVHAFPPGCWQMFDARAIDATGQSRPQRYWHFPSLGPVVQEPDAIERVRSLLNAAVREHLISDVPVGVFLSSGLDSTIVAALAAQHTDHLRTFTVGFAQEDGTDQSESRLAAQTARIIGSQHTDIRVTGDDGRRAAETWLSAAGGLDQPSIDGLNTYIISKVVRERGIVVALSGLGGDELFGGYATFSRIPRVMKVMRRLEWIPAWGRSALTCVATARRPEAVRQKAMDMIQTRGDTFELFLNSRRIMSNRQLTALGLTPETYHLTSGYLPAVCVEDLRVAGRDTTYNLSVLESRFYMGNTLLRDSDTNGMAHSLEIRVPLLDRRIIDYVYALPGGVRLPHGRADKHLLRRAFASKLRPELTGQQKRGFTLPIGEWMVGPLRELCEQGMRRLKSEGLLRPEGIDAVWNAFLRSDHVRWSRAFSLCVLGLMQERLSARAA